MKKYHMRNRKAFSLIELSIVIVVIGILIAGVTQGTRLVREFKISTARTVTQSSAVPGIRDLELWLETTGEKSFIDAEAVEGEAVGTWYDMNVNNEKHDASSTLTARPTYRRGALNGLPALTFDGTNDTMAPSFAGYSSNAPSTNNNFTLFLVAQTADTHGIDVQSDSGTAGQSEQKFVIFPQQGSSVYGCTSCVGTGISLGTNGVSFYQNTSGTTSPSAVYSGGDTAVASIIAIVNTNKKPKIYVNGQLRATGIESSFSTVYAGYIIGGNSLFSSQFFKGEVGEYIIYNRALVPAEQGSVEKYLGQKWGIKVYPQN